MPDLFDFFKENESKLHERPPEQAWEKLELRLEKRRRRRRHTIRFLQLGAVALALLLLLLAAGMVWYYVHQDKKRRDTTSGQVLESQQPHNRLNNPETFFAIPTREL